MSKAMNRDDYGDRSFDRGTRHLRPKSVRAVECCIVYDLTLGQHQGRTIQCLHPCPANPL